MRQGRTTRKGGGKRPVNHKNAQWGGRGQRGDKIVEKAATHDQYYRIPKKLKKHAEKKRKGNNTNTEKGGGKKQTTSK